MSYAKCARLAAPPSPPGRTWGLTHSDGRSFYPESGLLFATLAECCPQVEVLILSHSNVEEEVACLTALPKLRVRAPPAAGPAPSAAQLPCVPRASTPVGRSCVRWSREHAVRLTRMHEGCASGRAQAQVLLAAARGHLPAQALFLDSCRGLGTGSALLVDFAALRSLDLSWCCDLQAGSLARVGCGASKPLTPSPYKVLTVAHARSCACSSSCLLSRVYVRAGAGPSSKG
jgi:hypothetical protein